ncbi:MAG TPA: efflux RND transporter periplasmic adaptor subunit [Candidatus Binatia bacterium]|nr:efflux RND transporter periplasmic adaptor subunit [Candidatus Binatia bacterium]
MANPKKRKKRIIFSLIGVVLVALVLAAVFKKKEPVITVQAEKVSRHSLTNLVVANGQIQPVVQVTISPEVSGEIVALPVKEGQFVHSGDLLVKIKPDVYVAAVSQAKASYASSVAGEAQAAANAEKAGADYQRNLELFNHKLLSTSDFIAFKAARDVAHAQLESATNQVEMARAQVDSAEEQLAKTTILSPLTGTITRLNSEVGERVLGTVQNAGTEIMTLSDLNQIEARVNVGEMDVVGIKPGQKARLEVDAFKNRKFTGVVSAVANSAVGSGSRNSIGGSSSSSLSQQATQFEVRIRVNDKEPAFRPGMSVTAEIETEYRTNVLTVPLASVTTRPMKAAPPNDPVKTSGTNAAASKTNFVAGTNDDATTNTGRPMGKQASATKPTDVVFVVEGDHVKAVPVKIGICDDNYWEITDGLTNGEEVVSGGYRAIGRDLQDGSKIHVGPAGADTGVEKK